MARKPRTAKVARVCLTPNCNEVANGRCTGRGLCQRCYGHAKYMVNKGATTWTELESHGLASPVYSSCHNRIKAALDTARSTLTVIAPE